jgi:hypothetical protein
LKRHFERHFDSGRSIVGKENMLQSGWREIDQPLGQLDRGGVRRAEIRHVSDFVQLTTNGRVDPRMPMPVDVAPQAADAVEIGATVDIVKRAAFGSLDHQRLVFGHLGEGMPDVAAIPIDKLFASRHGVRK